MASVIEKRLQDLCPRHRLHGFGVCMCKKLLLAKIIGIEECAVEAEEPRNILLTSAQVRDGLVTKDAYPTLKIRTQMRREIAIALRVIARKHHKEIKDGKY